MIALPQYSTRPHLWLRSSEPLVCPTLYAGRPHRLVTNAALLQHEALICHHRANTRNAPECGARVYVLVFPGNLRYLVQLSTAEWSTMRARSMGVEEALEYLTQQISLAG